MDCEELNQQHLEVNQTSSDSDFAVAILVNLLPILLVFSSLFLLRVVKEIKI